MANTESDHARQKLLFDEWITIQKQEISELQEASRLGEVGEIDESQLNQLVEKVVLHFQDYIDKRIVMARRDVTPFFAPVWCSSLENSGFWIGGCRPSSFIRLIYGLTGVNLESHLAGFLRGSRARCDLGGLSREQMIKVDRLQREVIRKEDQFSSLFATLQDDMVDLHPLAAMASKWGDDQCPHETWDIEKELDTHGEKLAKILEEADKLRLDTLKKIVNILTPAQSVDFLAAAKKMRVCMQELGRKRDLDHGRT